MDNIIITCTQFVDIIWQWWAEYWIFRWRLHRTKQRKGEERPIPASGIMVLRLPNNSCPFLPILSLLIQVTIPIYFISWIRTLNYVFLGFHLFLLSPEFPLYIILNSILSPLCSTCPNQMILERLITLIICGLLNSSLNSLLFLIIHFPSLVSRIFSSHVVYHSLF